jgi:hypothetical protein
MNIDSMIEVLTAYKNGEQIQSKHCDGQWINHPKPAWDFYECEYRVKPKPLEMWVNLYGESNWSTFKTQREAEIIANQHSDHKRTIHMVEVDE